MGMIRNLLQAYEIMIITSVKKYKNKDGKNVELSSSIKKSKRDSYFYNGETLVPVSRNNNFKTKIVVLKETTTGAIIEEYNKNPNSNVFALNFANATTPGGGFLVGHSAQEESIFRNTTIIPSIFKNTKMYSYNILHYNKQLYHDKMIVSKSISVIRGNDGNLIESPAVASFITSPAVFATVAKRKGASVKKINEIMTQRIDKILNVCYKEGADVVVLGSFGCGVFGNNPEDVSLIFKDLIEGKYKNQFKKVIFAIYSRSKEDRNLEIFKEAFKQN